MIVVDESDSAAGFKIEVGPLAGVAIVVALAKLVVVVVVIVSGDKKKSKHFGCLFQPKNHDSQYLLSSVENRLEKAVHLCEEHASIGEVTCRSS